MYVYERVYVCMYVCEENVFVVCVSLSDRTCALVATCLMLVAACFMLVAACFMLLRIHIPTYFWACIHVYTCTP